MILIDTEEQKKLEKIFEPYHHYCKIDDDAPEEAKKAYEKWKEIGRQRYDEAIELMKLG